MKLKGLELLGSNASNNRLLDNGAETDYYPAERHASLWEGQVDRKEWGGFYCGQASTRTFPQRFPNLMQHRCTMTTARGACACIVAGHAKEQLELIFGNPKACREASNLCSRESFST